MYAGRGETVPLPTTGHLHIHKNGYVYWEDDERWDPERRRPVDSRRSIGKLDPNDSERMYPNETYRRLFGTVREPGFHNSVLSYGSYAVLRATAEKVGCLPILREVFPWEWDRVLALGIHSICAENSTAELFPMWAFHHYCGLDRPLSSEEISVVYEKIAEASKSIPAFLEGFRKSYFQRFPSSGELCLAFDSTNQSAELSNMLAAMGHAKKNKNRPQVNTAIFADERTGIPLFYEHFVGSIPDKTETPYTIEKASSLGFQKLFVMMDRGYFDPAAAKAITDMDLDFAISSPSNLNAVHALIDQHSGEFFVGAGNLRQQYYIDGEHIYGMAVPGVDILGGRYCAYLFYDYNRNASERNHILTQIEVMRKAIESRERYSKKMESTYAPWFTVKKTARDPATGRYFSWQVNDRAIENELARAGYFVIVSNKTLAPASIIHMARTRDVDEKAFRRFKWHFGLTSTYTHSLSTYEGKMFMAFVSTVIVEAYRWFAHDVLQASSSATVASTLAEMSKYTIEERDDGSFVPMYAATRIQKDILGCVGLDEAKLKLGLKEIQFR